MPGERVRRGVEALRSLVVLLQGGVDSLSTGLQGLRYFVTLFIACTIYHVSLE
jgi:hypothetical protein